MKIQSVRLAVLGLLISVGVMQAATITPEAEKTWQNTMERAKVKLASSKVSDVLPVPNQDTLASVKPKVVVIDSPDRNGVAVPKGLIHHWVGTVFVPGAHAKQVLAVMQDFNHYREIYAPAIADSQLLTQDGNVYEARLRMVQQGFGVRAGLIGVFRTTFTELSDYEGYAVTESQHIDELRSADELEVVPFSKAHGWVEKSSTIVRYKELSNGTELQVESFTLSRDVPAAIRVFANPLIRRFATQTMEATLDRLSARIQKSTDADLVARSTQDDVQ